MARNRVQMYRENLMLSKAELARRAGLSALTIDRVEAGRPCRLDTKRKILSALELKVVDHRSVFGPGGMSEFPATGVASAVSPTQTLSSRSSEQGSIS